MQRLLSPTVVRSRLGARAWRAALGFPGIPDQTRLSLADEVSAAMHAAGRPKGADTAMDAARAHVRDPRLRAQWLLPPADATLAEGEYGPEVREAWANQLELADELLAAGEGAEAAEELLRGTTMAFHRILHFDRTSSPLASDPVAYLAPLQRSVAAQALSAPRGRLRPARPTPTDRPLRLLLATCRNANFVGPLREHFAAHPSVEFRFVDTAEYPALAALDKVPADRVREVLTGATGAEDSLTAGVEEALRPHLDWADVVFAEWCTSVPLALTMIDPGEARIMVRLHSYEAFTLWPHLLDYSRIDDMIFVGPHIRDLTLSSVPRLRQSGARVSVLSNAVDLDRFALPKESDEARFTVGLVGISAIAKDPLWALEVLRLLREKDERYRLRLVGDDIPAKPSVASRLYRERLERELEPLVAEGAVERLGRTEDVPGALRGIGVLLSSSVREGQPNAIMEAAVSGTVPVVRDWPFFAGQPHSAASVLPAEWLVTSPREAADRILAVTGSAETWREHGEAAARHAREQWDWPRVRRAFDELLGITSPDGE